MCERPKAPEGKEIREGIGEVVKKPEKPKPPEIREMYEHEDMPRKKLVRTCDNCKYLQPAKSLFFGLGWSHAYCKKAWWGLEVGEPDQAAYERRAPDGCSDWKYAMWRMFWDRVMQR